MTKYFLIGVWAADPVLSNFKTPGTLDPNLWRRQPQSTKHKAGCLMLLLLQHFRSPFFNGGLPTSRITQIQNVFNLATFGSVAH